MGVNKVILLGRLGKDPELRYTTNTQTPVCSFSLATGDRRKDASGNWSEHTEWHNITALGKTAETCSNYLKKGREVYLEGKIQTRKWQDKEGKDRWTTEILASTVQFVGSRDGASSPAPTGPEQGEQSAADVLDSLQPADAVGNGGGAVSSATFEEDDIPF